MQLDSITITNFRSFAGEQVFVFPREPGLYFMQGVNEVEPRLGANGAGKSTIWDALTWCLFGKTPRGLKAGEVCNWESKKGTRVVLVFHDLNGVEYTTTRTWGPISWRVRVRDVIGNQGDFDDEYDLAKDPSNPIMACLRLEFSPFLNCILMAQGQPMFLDQKADAQATLFSDVMGLDRWLEYSGAASTKASAQDSISRVLESELSRARGQLEALAGDDLADSSKEWETKREARLNELEAEYARLLDKLKKEQDKVVDLDERTQNQRALVAKLREPVENLKRDSHEIEARISDYRITLAGDQRDLDQLNDQLDHLKDHEVCPACKQRLPKADYQAHVSEVRAKWRKAKARVDVAEDQIKKDAPKLARTAQELQTAEGAHLDAQITLDGLLGDLAAARREVSTLNRELDRIEEQSEEVEGQANPYEAMQKKALEDRQELTQKIRGTQRKLDDSNYRYSILSYWVRGFKELRLQLIAEALTELEIEVNSCVAALGLLDWELRFQVDRETKGGNIQRGFSVLVKSPRNESLVPWESWSGGEAQRLRLAGTMGLSNLIRSRSGTELELEVWDEPTRDLSPQGVQDLLESLAARAQQEQRMIWLVDHRTYDFGGFAGGVTVIKTKQGSKLIATSKGAGE